MAKNFYEFAVKSIKEEPTPLSTFKGKVSLVVNTASECGLTPQYKDLQAIHDRYKAQGFNVLGFPSNDFGAQEPGSNEEIAKFCDISFKTTFPLFAKGPVKGPTKQELYKYLTEESSPTTKGEITWNFEKFLIGRDGTVLKRFSPKTIPTDKEVTSAIESALG